MIACSLRTALPLLVVVSCNTLAQTSLPGTVVVIPAFGEVTRENDEARLTLAVEEQDKDKSLAASRVNLKMRQGTEAVKRADPKAVLKTRGYYSYPVFADQPPPKTVPRTAPPIAWRIGQYLDVTTANLASLPKTVADAQGTLAVSALHFGLSPAAVRGLDEKRIAAAYQNLGDRISAVARAMGRNPADAILDTVDLDGAGTDRQVPEAVSKLSYRSAVMPAQPVEEPSYEPGESSLQMRLVARVRFK